MRHQIERERCVGAPCIESGHGQTTGRQTFTDEEDDSERLLNDPMLEIKNAAGSERNQAEKREQLVAPLHGSRCRSAWFALSTKEALVRSADPRQTALPWRNRSCSSFATAGASTLAGRRSAKKTATPPCLRARHFTTGCIMNTRVAS